MSELRQNLATKEWVVISSERAKKPNAVLNKIISTPVSDKNYDPEEFKSQHPVPDGYIDILTKWYSIKFTYPEFNYIFIRPGVGISLQMHAMREEHWACKN